MKVKIDDEMLDKLVIKRLQSDAKIIRSFLKPLSKKVRKGKELTPVQYEDYLNMDEDLAAINTVLEYYGVFNAK